ncbi:MAG: polysaccharide pyruvyl transferase family protein [Candidatus Omnitrophica bacterium]|nr:polysaccharide pyruvyl transferase family protein [Candidatus Omnitrophota bacterium]
MYILLTGAKKNAGDFLIAHSAKRLFERFAPDRTFQELPSWLPVTEHLDLINSAKALILCGGPAYQSGLGTRIYPILEDLDRIRVPIVSFGLGWKSFPGDDFDLKTFAFDSSSEPLLARIRNDFKYAGCRDYLTLRLLERLHFKNAWMTGCPAWYDPDCFGLPPAPPEKVERILFTPAETPRFKTQSLAVLRLLRDLFPKAGGVCSFHRGWTVDEHTTEPHAANAAAIKEAAERMGFEAWDASGTVEVMRRYREFDFHVGYRVHAHFRFLSLRKLSFLIAEDGRGRGALDATGPLGVLGWRPSHAARFATMFQSSEGWARGVRRVLGSFRMDPATVQNLRRLILSEFEMGNPNLRATLDQIDSTWPRMREMLTSLPK